MAENESHSKIKKRKAFLSDSEDDEVLKKHKAADLDEPTDREVDLHGKIPEKYAVGSQQPMEGKKNGKYEKSVENGLTDSDSAGTDVEPTTDDESPQPNRRPKKKRKISIKNERRSRNNLQVGSSSESEDEGPLSPKSPSSSKKSFRRRRTISGGKAPSKKSSDSESYKTDSESDEDSQNRVPSKGSTTTETRPRGKERGTTSQALKERKRAKNKVEEGSSDSEDDIPLQKPKHHSSSEESDRATKDNEEHVSPKTDKREATTESKKVIDIDTLSSSSQCSNTTGPHKRVKTERNMKQESSSDGGKVKTDPETTDDSEDETSRNPDAAKRGSTSGDSDSKPLSKGKPDREEIKKEKSSNDSESDSSHVEKTAKGAEAKRRSESPLNNAKNKKLHNDSDSSSSKESTKKEKRRKNKLPDEDKRIISLKKYLKIAGIRVHNYSDLWKDCRSNKARAQKLLSLLEENGLKGRPTIEKCKKLRKKIETRREVEELDLANVMECGAEGRTRRSRQRTSVSQELPNETPQTSSDVRKRLQVLADSDSSESD
ncbi:lisH domain-containing protein C1711.05-like isoform X1 [Schistocerca piceifrons]|uniref:lisH domain-containing protein C1711.05-like isoform X1 n=1 Tax=Schistocerca piceifrons TaxID=274613 RepID=UPI001F5FADA5|nr:lisH domain-containing protein C1711.05-like isoform X1 [Schistocerca piceifrons]XP_047097123.1 lisH domain-containing protein C1711.05-like isoform X1 [Schistocerca piceifrons]XP_047097124.1 lisH domain-containing protein C1711.05-like isoform X1 [Schistocerca piceifrons]XP_047097125.1 lisH domain-containing protein C1711.05-like isoform X1 [Schistocerca piceifrons]